jgi:hypothetical protein
VPGGGRRLRLLPAAAAAVPVARSRAD